MVDNSVVYILAGYSNFPLSLGVVYFELKMEYGEKSRSGRGQETRMKRGVEVARSMKTYVCLAIVNY